LYTLKPAAMKKLQLASLLLFTTICMNSTAQESVTSGSESFGRTLNVGVGIGYYGYVAHPFPVIHANYEFGVGRNFTLAPFITVFTYRNYYYWGDPNYPFRNYYYRRTIIPVGVKGSYYFDELLGAGSDWDFYLGASLGFVFRKTVWETGYYGETTVVTGPNPFFIDGHVGAEYHFNARTGLFLDLSRMSTIGLAFHM